MEAWEHGGWRPHTDLLTVFLSSNATVTFFLVKRIPSLEAKIETFICQKEQMGS